MFWEYTPSSANLASNLLRAKRDEEETKKINDGVDTSLASERIDIFVGGAALSMGSRMI